MIAEEGRAGGGLPDLEDEWKMGCPKSPMWESEDDALRVIGLYGPGDKISLFLQDWELAKVALSCHMALDAVPGNA